MEASKSDTKFEEEDLFFDAPDEFPFYDFPTVDEPERSVSISSPAPQPEPPTVVSVDSKPSPESPSQSGLRRRRSISQHVRGESSSSDSKISNPVSSVTFDSTLPAKRKYSFIQHLKENERESGKSDSNPVRLISERDSEVADKETRENSTITTVNEASASTPVRVDLGSGGGGESSSNLLFILAGFLINAIGFQISLLVRFFSFPVWLLYFSYLFVIDPFQVFRRGKEYLTFKLLGTWGAVSSGSIPYIYKWLKEHKSFLKLVWRFVWGFIWASYVCVVLIGLLMSAFVVSGLTMRSVVEEPMQIKEPLTFDYTNSSPAAFVPVISCAAASCLNCEEKHGLGTRFGPRVIPAKYKLKVSVALKMPESDYNRNLGIFQVRVDFLSAIGRTLASSRRPCMMIFRSQPLRFLLSFLRAAPLLAGYSTESQTLNIKFNGFTEGDTATACLRVVLEQRAQFSAGAGIPEIYEASAILESELPPLRRIIWHWRKTLFIWVAMTTFTVELVFALLCCRPMVMPRVRLRGCSTNNRN